jgi:hypothetical protein
MSCSQADDSKTVDGDAIGTKQPKGDGFYNQPNSNGDLRDYRNSDDANSLSDREFAIVGDEQSSEDLTKLRLQGGTGNCGSVMSRAGGTTGGSLFFAALGLMVLPLLMAAGLALRTRKRWK